MQRSLKPQSTGQHRGNLPMQARGCACGVPRIAPAILSAGGRKCDDVTQVSKPAVSPTSSRQTVLCSGACGFGNPRDSRFGNLRYVIAFAPRSTKSHAQTIPKLLYEGDMARKLSRPGSDSHRTEFGTFPTARRRFKEIHPCARPGGAALSV